MAEGKTGGGGESLSLQTLVVAALASATAAIVVSHLWKDGTVIAAAMTPVIVTIVKELLTRPMESDIVRRPVQQVGRLASSGRIAVPGRARSGSSGETRVLPPTEERPAAPANGGGPPPGGPETLTPIRTYGRGRRRPIHLKIALITGLVAFVVAAAALTLPELILGGAISSHHSTTLFGGGGGGGKSKTDTNANQQNKTSTQPQQSKQQGQQTTPAAPPQGGSSSKPPPTSGPSSTTPQKSPQQTTPQQTSPIPTTPAPAP